MLRALVALSLSYRLLVIALTLVVGALGVLAYGSLPVEEGARVHGLHTATSWGATDIHLLSVGRDGRTVTVVSWGQMGDFDDAPVAAFRKTTTKAVAKLY